MEADSSSAHPERSLDTMDNTTQSGASGDPEVAVGLNDSAFALKEMTDEQYQQKRAAFATRHQSLLETYAQSGGSIFKEAEQKREKDAKAIDELKREKEEAIWESVHGADSPSLFPGRSTYLDICKCKTHGIGDPAEWVNQFDQ